MSNEHESSAGLGKIARDPDDDLKEAFHELPYGMYVIGSSDGATPNAMIADWVMQVSFNPRLISVSYEIDSSTLARIRKHKFFTVNLLNQENNGMALAAKFVQPTDSTKIKGRQGDGPAQKMNKLDGIDYWLSDTAVGCPILENALVYIECVAEQFIETGDHVLVIDKIIGGEPLNSGEPLTSTYPGWNYSG